MQDILDNEKGYSKDTTRDPIYSHSSINFGYCIFRVGKKYKSISQIKGFERHMERKAETPNANPDVQNELLIGSRNVTEDVLSYLQGCYKRSDSVIARDILLTASPEFFQRVPYIQKRLWVETNVKWLKDNFGDNCVYATLHKDETTWHISALIVPKFYNTERGYYILANSRYFNGIVKMSEWQDKYAESISDVFKSLKRGLKYSKAKHVEIRTFYSIVNKDLDEKDIKSICAKAKNSELVEVKVKQLQKTLNRYKDYVQSKDKQAEEYQQENKVLYHEFSTIKKDKAIYKEAIKIMAETFDVPQSSIIQILQHAEKKLTQDNSKGKSLELKK